MAYDKRERSSAIVRESTRLLVSYLDDELAVRNDYELKPILQAVIAYARGKFAITWCAADVQRGFTEIAIVFKEKLNQMASLGEELKNGYLQLLARLERHVGFAKDWPADADFDLEEVIDLRSDIQWLLRESQHIQVDAGSLELLDKIDDELWLVMTKYCSNRTKAQVTTDDFPIEFWWEHPELVDFTKPRPLFDEYGRLTAGTETH